MKKWLLFLCTIICLWGCEAEDIPTPTDPENEEQTNNAPLTILAYLIANNNLNVDILGNISTMYDGLATMDRPATLLIYWDGKTAIGKNKSTHLILKYETDGKGKINGLPTLDETATLDDILEVGKIMKEYSTQLSTDKQVMSSVLKDMVGMSSSGRCGLIVGSHGSSWYHTIATRALGYDGSTSNSILLPDMVEAMESVGKTFDFILFDACYMGSVEVCYEFRNVTNYQISSVMEVPAYGFPYNNFMKYLFQGTAESYIQVCRSFVDYYKSEYNSGHSAWGTIALIDSKEVQSLTSSIKQEIVSHKDILADYDASRVQEYGRQSGSGIAYDLEHFVKDLNNNQVPNSFKTQLDKTVLYKGCLEKARYSSYDYDIDASNFCGLGIYIPKADKSKWNTYFKTLDWFEVSGWNEVNFSWKF